MRQTVDAVGVLRHLVVLIQIGMELHAIAQEGIAELLPAYLIAAVVYQHGAFICQHHIPMPRASVTDVVYQAMLRTRQPFFRAR